MNMSKIIILFLLIIFTFWSEVFAQQIPVSLQKETMKISNEEQNLKPNLDKIHCQLYDVYLKIKRSGESIEKASDISNLLLEIDPGSVRDEKIRGILYELRRIKSRQDKYIK